MSTTAGKPNARQQTTIIGLSANKIKLTDMTKVRTTVSLMEAYKAFIMGAGGNNITI